MSTGWDNATLKKLKALTGKGLSTAEIGKRLGMSKNAVVGKLNRMGWNPKATGGAPVEDASAAPKRTQRSTAKKATAAPEKKKETATKKTPTKKAVAATAPAAKKSASGKNASVTITEPKKNEAPVAKKVASASRDDVTQAPKNLAMHQRIIQHSLEMANLKPNQCRWPIGDPDSENFHFCGATVFVGKPYCYEHCKMAYQFTPPKKK
ncbi:MAG: hypothetical protein IJ560_00340 [Alphaproteobacteria bacterium]|nr:hypothetical protein [Alphaproteobacteria bacterium]